MLLDLVGLLLLSILMAHIIPAMLAGDPPDDQPPGPGPGSDSDVGPAAPGPGYRPTPMDIVLLRAALNRSKGLPPDIVDCIFDHAEYWAYSSSAVHYGSELQQTLRIFGTSPQENKFLLRSCPLGLTSIRGAARLAEELVYDTSEARPLPLAAEHDAGFFARLVDYPTPRLANPCRKIVFSIRSHDQGWGGGPLAGPYDNSWTWFEAGLERLDASQHCDDRCTYDARQESASEQPPALPVCGLRPLQPPICLAEAADAAADAAAAAAPHYLYDHPLQPQSRFVVHMNQMAMNEWQDHVVTWSYLDADEPGSSAADELRQEGRGGDSGDGAFVRGLKLGDVVTVWGKARFPGWVNNVESVRIDVYWAV